MIIVVRVETGAGGRFIEFVDPLDLDVNEVLRIMRTCPSTSVIGTMERLEPPHEPKTIAAAFRFEDVYTNQSSNLRGLDPFMSASRDFRQSLIDAWAQSVEKKPAMWSKIITTLMIGKQTRFDIELDIDP